MKRQDIHKLADTKNMVAKCLKQETSFHLPIGQLCDYPKNTDYTL